MCILIHNEDNRSSVGVGNATSCNNRMLLHHVLINTLNVDKAIYCFDDTAVCSCNTTICTTIDKCSCVIKVSRCRYMEGSCHRSIDYASCRGRFHHFDGVSNTFNDYITRVWCRVGLLGRVLGPINVEFLLISHHMSYIARRER